MVPRDRTLLTACFFFKDTAPTEIYTLSLHDALPISTRLVQVPVSTGGRLGAVTIFADGVHHRWLVRCDGLAPNEPDQAYKLWFITDKGMRTAAIMPMDQDRPMVMALEMPTGDAHVIGAAMTIEQRAGSAEPRGPLVFHRLL